VARPVGLIPAVHRPASPAGLTGCVKVDVTLSTGADLPRELISDRAPHIGVNSTRGPITSRSVGLVEAKSGRRYQWWPFVLSEVVSWSCLWAANQSACCRIRSCAEASWGRP
jgi:hypothetical protein